MSIHTITIDFPSDILLALNEDENELKKNIKISLAIRLFQQEKLTLGKAAQLCNMSRLEFETLLSENNIPISNPSLDEVIKDSKKLN